MDEILPMEKVLYYSGVNYIKYEYFLKAKLFNLNSYQIIYPFNIFGIKITYLL